MPAEPDAIVYADARVWTGDPAHPHAGALRVASGRVTHVLDADDPALPGRRVHLGGATVLPGLVDAHLHLRGVGLAGRELDLKDAGSADDVVARVRAAAAGSAPGAWIRGRGWDHHRWPGGAWPAGGLDDLDHPVWLVRVDGHAVWANARALDLAGIDARTPDPPGGELVRDGDGRPTGILVDNAIALAESRLPAPTAKEVRTDVLCGIGACLGSGLTGVHAMAVDRAELEALRALEAEGTLDLRVTCYVDGRDTDLVDEVLSRPPAPAEGLLRVAGVKVYADGALGSRGAALEADYADRPGHRGLLLVEPGALAAFTRRVSDAGWQLALHAIGDRGNRVVLDAIAAAGDGGARRHRVEHAQILGPDAPARMKALGAVASLQPTHCTSDMGWVEAALGPDRLAGAYAWKTVLDAGVPLALGSDAPVESEDPWTGIHAAVTRQDARGEPPGGFRPGERLTVAEAIRGYTAGAAFAAHDGGRLGVLAPGRLADLTVADADPFAVAPGDLCRVRTLRTVVAGRTVFEAGA